MHHSVAKKFIWLFLLVFAAAYTAGNAWAATSCVSYATHGGVTDGYYAQSGTTTTPCTFIINAYGFCKVVAVGDLTAASPASNPKAPPYQLFIPAYSGNAAIGQAELASFFAHPPAEVSVTPCNCNLPWGGSLTSGQSVTAYQNSTEPCHGTCASQTRTCACTDGGTCGLTGSYTKQSCSVTACLACTLPWGGQIADSTSATAYSTSTVGCGSSCAGQTRSCNNGALSGSYTKQTCTVDPCPCTLPWGGSISSGGNVAAYKYASKACGGSCGGTNQQTRICGNGNLSGTYTNQSCAVDPCGCTARSHTWNTHCSGSVAAKSSGQSETVSNTASGYTGSIKASCSNGVWGYSNASCTAKSCTLPWGGTLASGSNTTAYQASSVPYGSSCVSQTRVCTAGNLSGNYTKKTCTVQAPASCSATSHTWNTHCTGSVAAKSSGQSETVSNTASGYTGSIKASCSNGVWGYSNASCTAVPTNCAADYVSWGSGCDASTPALANGASTTVYYDDCPEHPGVSGGTWGNVKVTCSSGSLTQSNPSCTTQACFVPGTYVLMADGSSKFIEDLQVGDKVMGATRVNTVIGVPNYNNPTPIYGFNGGKPFVTGGHPFWTQDGWKAIDPALTPAEHHNVKTTRLQVGDVLALENGRRFVVHSINKGRKPGPHHVFDPQVDGDHTYYANGLLVHNKRACP